MAGITIAPWLPEQVRSLNGYQESSGMHPFTCPNDRSDLHATPAGWRCRHCNYEQEWAHEFMADDTWKGGPQMWMIGQLFGHSRPEA